MTVHTIEINKSKLANILFRELVYSEPARIFSSSRVGQQTISNTDIPTKFRWIRQNRRVDSTAIQLCVIQKQFEVTDSCQKILLGKQELCFCKMVV